MGLQLPLDPTAYNIALAKEFVFEKWVERAVELGKKELPNDLTRSCKFSALFAQKIFGGELQGNWDHLHIKVDGKVIDLNVEAGDVIKLLRDKGLDTYKHSPSFFKRKELKESLASCTARVEGWFQDFKLRFGIKEASVNPLKQAFSRANLYRFMSLETFIVDFLENNSIPASNSYTARLNGKSYNGVSLTRDPHLKNNYDPDSFFAEVRVTLDASKLKTNYKLYPYVDPGYSSRLKDKSEAEEFIVGSIRNPLDFTAQVAIDLTKTTPEALELLEQVKGELPSDIDLVLNYAKKPLRERLPAPKDVFRDTPRYYLRTELSPELIDALKWEPRIISDGLLETSTLTTIFKKPLRDEIVLVLNRRPNKAFRVESYLSEVVLNRSNNHYLGFLDYLGVPIKKV